MWNLFTSQILESRSRLIPDGVESVLVRVPAARGHARLPGHPRQARPMGRVDPCAFPLSAATGTPGRRRCQRPADSAVVSAADGQCLVNVSPLPRRCLTDLSMVCLFHLRLLCLLSAFELPSLAAFSLPQ